MRRTIRLLALLFLFAANVAVLATGAAGRPSGAATATAVASAGADFDNDGFADLAVGAPAEDVGSAFNAGAVSGGSRLFTQNSAGVPGTAEAFDSFGGNAFNAG
jgi:hypothetical protein